MIVVCRVPPCSVAMVLKSTLYWYTVTSSFNLCTLSPHCCDRVVCNTSGSPMWHDKTNTRGEHQMLLLFFCIQQLCVYSLSLSLLTHSSTQVRWHSYQQAHRFKHTFKPVRTWVQSVFMTMCIWYVGGLGRWVTMQLNANLGDHSLTQARHWSNRVQIT